MEEEITGDNNAQPVPKTEANQKPQVYILRDWKEYVGESFLIIFSVLLALVLTEFINSLHEKNETRDMLINIRNELSTNRQFEIEQYAYHQSVIKTIDSAIMDPSFQKKIVSDDKFHMHYLTPHGLLYHYLDDVAWEVAKNHSISTKASFKTISLLTHIYDDQARIMKVEDEIAKVVLSPESRKVENAHLTLMLIRDNYEGWAVDRAPGLIKQYDEAIKLLGEEK